MSLVWRIVIDLGCETSGKIYENARQAMKKRDFDVLCIGFFMVDEEDSISYSKIRKKMNFWNSSFYLSNFVVSFSRIVSNGAMVENTLGE
jgi:hypothetical protein